MDELRRFRVPFGVEVDETYFCIVYALVPFPEGQLDVDAVVSQLDFFHITGFHSVAFNPDNWLGRGVLVDFSDLVSPLENDLRWVTCEYAEHQATCRAMISGLSSRGDLRPCPRLAGTSSGRERQQATSTKVVHSAPQQRDRFRPPRHGQGPYPQGRPGPGSPGAREGHDGLVARRRRSQEVEHVAAAGGRLSD